MELVDITLKLKSLHIASPSTPAVPRKSSWIVCVFALRSLFAVVSILCIFGILSIGNVNGFDNNSVYTEAQQYIRSSTAFLEIEFLLVILQYRKTRPEAFSEHLSPSFCLR